MDARILEKLSRLTAEEQYILVEQNPTPRDLYGKSGRFIVERRRVSHLVSGEATAPVCLRMHPRFRSFPTHSHDFIEIMYVCHGSVTHDVGGEKIRLDTDELILFGRYAEHSILETGKDDIGVNLIISPDLFEQLLRGMGEASPLPVATFASLLDREGPSHLHISAKDSIAVRNLMETLVGTVVCEGNTDGYLLRQSLALLLCYLVSLGEGGEHPPVERYTDRMQRRLLNYIKTSYSTATLTEAATMMGLSPSYLSRWIEKSFGRSFKELLMQERFETARSLLSATSMPVGEIINRVGYENSSYFHKEFKRRYGITPNRYRKGG